MSTHGLSRRGGTRRAETATHCSKLRYVLGQRDPLINPLDAVQARTEARAKARASAHPGDWLSLGLDHHQKIGAAFDVVRKATSLTARRTAQRALGVLPMGHSIAEESVLYPALALTHEQGHSALGYIEQSAVKVQMTALEDLEPMSGPYLDKLDQIAGAVAHHMYEEERIWFPELSAKTAEAEGARLTARYVEEFRRYRADD